MGRVNEKSIFLIPQNVPKYPFYPLAINATKAAPNLRPRQCIINVDHSNLDFVDIIYLVQKVLYRQPEKPFVSF